MNSVPVKYVPLSPCLSWPPPSIRASSPYCFPLPPPSLRLPASTPYPCFLLTSPSPLTPPPSLSHSPLSSSLSPPTRDEVNRHVIVAALPASKAGPGSGGISRGAMGWEFTLTAGLSSVKQSTGTHVCISVPTGIPVPCSYPPATRQLPAHQGMMMSANLRLGPMKRSNAGLTNLVYCAITPVM